MTIIRHDLFAAVKEILELLADEKYHQIERLTKGVRLSAAEIRYAVDSYGRRVSQPTEEELSQIDIVKVKKSRPQKWSVFVPLRTVEEGRSDLSAVLTLVEHPDRIDIELDDLRVL